MEKAVLKTLAYTDILDYPLKIWEIHKWLISQEASLYQVEKAVERLVKKGKIKNLKDYYFLPSKKGLVLKRLKKEKLVKRFFLTAKISSLSLKVIPYIKFIGVNYLEGDLDLILITEKDKVFKTKLFSTWILDLLGVRKKRDKDKSRGKINLKVILEKNSLEWTDKNLDNAYQILQMKVLWQREKVYSKFLEKNNWVFKFFPNWTTNIGSY